MHDWYDWTKDIALPLLTAGASVFVGVAALRVAQRGHELAADAENRIAREARFGSRQRVAAELLDYVRVREWNQSAPPVTAGVGLKIDVRPGTAQHANDRDEDDILSSASTLAAVLSDADRTSFDWLVNDLVALLKDTNRPVISALAEVAKVSIEQWVRQPEEFLVRVRRDNPQLDPEAP